MFFPEMSIFWRSISRQSPKNEATARRWLENDCVLCGGVAADALCEDCVGALHRIGNACQCCALPLATGDVCGACLRRPPAFDGAIAVFAYRFPLDRLVQRFKYAGDLAIGRWLGGQLAERA